MILAAGTLLGALAHTLGVLILARVIQGAAGGIFPLAFGIVRDEFPRERVAGSIGLMSSILGVGAGAGIVLSGVIVEHLNYHWLFWIPLFATIVARGGHVAVRAGIPGARSRAGQLARGGLDERRHHDRADRDQPDHDLGVGLAEDARAAGARRRWLCLAWVRVEVRSGEPLIDMAMMRIRGVWTTNLAAFLLGAGMYSSFIVIPQIAQLPTSTGFGFGASVVVVGPVPAALDGRSCSSSG